MPRGQIAEHSEKILEYALEASAKYTRILSDLGDYALGLRPRPNAPDTHRARGPPALLLLLEACYKAALHSFSMCLARAEQREQLAMGNALATEPSGQSCSAGMPVVTSQSQCPMQQHESESVGSAGIPAECPVHNASGASAKTDKPYKNPDM